MVPTVMDRATDAFGVTPLAAITVNEYVPVVVGVPDSTPPVVRVRPGGRVPVFEKVIGAVPVAVNV